MQAIITNISVITDDELMFYLVAKNKVSATWQNMYHLYYGYDEVLEDIVNFIKILENAQELSKKPVPKDKNEEGKMANIQMWKDFLASPNLSTESFELILNASNIGVRLFDFENTGKDRLEIMITKKSFAFDINVFDNLEKHHALGLMYLEVYKQLILQFKETFEIEEQHLSLILKSKLYTVSEINNILSKVDISSWQSDSFLSNLHDCLHKNKELEVDTAKIIEASEQYSSDSHNVTILNNYFDYFDKAGIKQMINLLENREYEKYLSIHISEGIKIVHTSFNDTLFDLMKRDKYIGTKSRKTKEGYVIYKNKDTISL